MQKCNVGPSLLSGCTIVHETDTEKSTLNLEDNRGRSAVWAPPRYRSPVQMTDEPGMVGPRRGSWMIGVWIVNDIVYPSDHLLSDGGIQDLCLS